MFGQKRRSDPAPALVDSRTVHVNVPPRRAFAPIRCIGGNTGWYYADFLWRLRGLIDRCAGGPGMHRGRARSDRVGVGDVIDFWRVEAFEPDGLLRLSAEFVIPGRGWLEFHVASNGTGSTIRQTARYIPRGALGKAYWYGLYPLHWLVFRGMLRGIAARAERADENLSEREK